MAPAPPKATQYDVDAESDYSANVVQYNILRVINVTQLLCSFSEPRVLAFFYPVLLVLAFLIRCCLVKLFDAVLLVLASPQCPMSNDLNVNTICLLLSQY
jgi:ABC-type transport system involved in multi-copper enzyme maturation permease subunit